MPTVIRIDERDHVGVALTSLTISEQITFGGMELTVRSDIPAGHKIALVPLAVGEAVCKFGHPIGHALAPIEAGEHVHSHNLGPLSGSRGMQPVTPASWSPAPATGDAASFQGYARQDGGVGTRNEIWILCLSGAARTTAEQITLLSSEKLQQGIDGIFAFDVSDSSPTPDEAYTRAIASLAAHPNAGGVLLIGLQPPDLEQFPGANIKGLGLQQAGDEIGEGLRLVEELSEQAAIAQRTTQPLASLVVGLKCGATDGFSGLTGNPLLGRASDLIVSSGGSVILTELSEILAAECQLAARAASADVTVELHSVVETYRSSFDRFGLAAPYAPNPGNLAGGITTLEEKAAGALQKAGHAPLSQVVRYGDRVVRRGFALLEAPGTDEVSTAALAIAGANLILFSTGRGTPLGAPVPALKIASNSKLAAAKPHWIDFDAGPLLQDGISGSFIDSFMSLIIATASGRPCRAELNGSREAAFWKRGVFV